MKTSITKIFTFEAAHMLDHHQGKCRFIHGHSYKLEVTVEGPTWPVDSDNPQSGMIMDFGLLKEIVEERVLSRVDHQFLNNLNVYPTAELLAAAFFNWIELGLRDELPRTCPEMLHEVAEQYIVRVVRVRLWETATSYAEVRR